MICKNCGKEVPEKSLVCPFCTMPISDILKPISTNPAINSVVGLVIFGLIFYGGYNFLTHGIKNSVASDAVKQYEIAKQQGDKNQICLEASMVSAAYLQAQDQENYNKWKAIEKNDCKNAGLNY